jgi:hypothetical protein
MVAPPLVDDALYVIVALLELAHITDATDGAEGTAAAVVIELLVPLDGPLPNALVAYTVNVYEVNPANPLTVILPEPL